MQLKKSTDYALRIILCLGNRAEGASSKEIAKEVDIPNKYLLGLCRILKQKGLIRTQRGVNGGYKLNRDLDEITLYDIVVAMEEIDVMKVCLEEEYYNKDTNNQTKVKTIQIYNQLQECISIHRNLC